MAFAPKRKRSARETAKREKSFRQHLAKKNAPRGRIVLPPDVRIEDLDWGESAQEAGFRRLHEMDVAFEKAELEHLRRKCALLEAIIRKDRERGDIS
ncbi:MAG TPA: hypothetical protein VJN92_15595 [Candidatus Acidoferrum sp.]|nr:hypothetical protein [Candidatus Acidoferrum sp.]